MPASGAPKRPRRLSWTAIEGTNGSHRTRSPLYFLFYIVIIGVLVLFTQRCYALDWRGKIEAWHYWFLESGAGSYFFWSF